jgi:hypothetical protein
MRVRAAILPVLFLLVASLPACAIKPKIQPVVEDASQPPKISTRDWNGEPITIHNDGIDLDGESGAVEVRVSAEATTISAQAVFAAHADVDRPANAKQSISDVIETFTIGETASSFDVACRHGQTHGTSWASASGCKSLVVTIPASSAEKPHTLTVFGGSGAVRVGVDDAPHVKSLIVDSLGSSAVDVRVRPVNDATLEIVAQDTVKISVPGDFSAKRVVFAVAAARGAELATAIVASDFPGMVDGAAYPPSGPTPAAVALLRVESRGPLEPRTIEVLALEPPLR